MATSRKIRRACFFLLLVAAFLQRPAARAEVLDYSQWTNNGTLIVNQSYPWGPVYMGSVLRLTDKGNGEACSVFTRQRVNISHFTNSFVFRIYAFNRDHSACSDGFAFVIQGDTPQAVGDGGGSLGYGGIHMSVAIKFDTAQNGGDPSNDCTGLFTNGATPIGGSDLSKTGIDLHAGHPMRCDMIYDGTTLEVIITDLTSGHKDDESYPIDIPGAVNATTAYVGFTGGTGDNTSAQDIVRWHFDSGQTKPATTRHHSKPAHGHR
jgi:hypothetical protein